MKFIQYSFLSCQANIGTEEAPNMEAVYLEKVLPYTEENERIAAQEANDGLYSIIERPEEIAAPTRLDAMEAQLAYTAMMTDTLLEV